MLEDMLSIRPESIRLEEQLPLVEFAYNNSYQASIRMVPYEALYGRPCRSRYVGPRWERAPSLVLI